MRFPPRSAASFWLAGIGLCLLAPTAMGQAPDSAPAPAIVASPRPAIAPEPVTLPARVAPAPQRAPAPDQWDLSTEVSLTDQSGNRVLRLFTGAVKFSNRQKKAYRLDGRVQSRYGKSEGEVVARNHYGSLSLDVHPSGHWSPFLSAEAERDPIKRLDLRLNGGAGATYMPFRGRDILASSTISLGLLYSYEDLSAKGTAPEPDPRLLARWNLRMQGQQKVQPAVTLSMLSLYQPAWGEMDDYLLRTEAGARFSVTRRLAVSMEYQVNRNAQPPTGVAPNDRLLKTGLVLDF